MDYVGLMNELIHINRATGLQHGLGFGVGRRAAVLEEKCMNILNTCLLCGGLAGAAWLAQDRALAADDAPTMANRLARLSRQSEPLSTGPALERRW